MHDAILVQLTDSKNDLCDVELDFLFRKACNFRSFFQLTTEITTNDQGHDEIKSITGREEVIHVTQVLMSTFEEHLKLCVHCPNHTALGNKLVLANVLYGKQFLARI